MDSIITSVVVSSLVSMLIMSYNTKMLDKFMDNFFEEETKRMKEAYDDASIFHKENVQDGLKTICRMAKEIADNEVSDEN